VTSQPPSSDQEPVGRTGATRWLRGLALDITPLRQSHDLRYLFGGQAINLIGSQMRMVAIPYLVFLITGHSSLAVGLISMVQFLPQLITSWIGGALADTTDRRRMLIFTQVLLTITSAMLTVAAFIGTPRLWYLFIIVGCASAIGAVDAPARRAAIPRLVSRDQIANSMALNQIITQLGGILGPSLAGLILASLGVAPALLIDTLTFLVSLASLMFMAPLPPSEAAVHNQKRGFAAIKEGLVFLKDTPIIGSIFLVDCNAMFFGGPRALFPALALDVFKVGEQGLGFMYAAPGVGAMVAALMSGWIGRVRRQGRAVVIAVCVWGAAITIFGLITHLFWLALVFLALAYAADATSAIFRSTIIQLAVPDRLRGRLSAIHFLAVGTGPQLGNVESGVVAQIAGPEFAVVSGGIAAAVGALIIGAAIPVLMHYDVYKEPEVLSEAPAAG
jgi:MFS family permease